MTAYLIDENVLREFGTRGNANVRKWLATVDDVDLRLSVATLFEIRDGSRQPSHKFVRPGCGATVRGIIEEIPRSYDVMADRESDAQGLLRRWWSAPVATGNSMSAS